MKKFYVLTVVCIGLCIQGFAQDYTWNGGTSGNWNNSANWDPVGIPDAAGENAIFITSTTVTLDVSNEEITLNSIKIIEAGLDVTLTTPASTPKIVNLTNTSPLTGALNIKAGSTLRLNTGASSVLVVAMAADSKGIIDGTLSLEGADNMDFFSIFELKGMLANTTQVNISNTGAIIVKNNSNSILAETDGFLNFNAGSELRLEDNAPIIPPATYSESSDIFITGITSGNVTIDEHISLGNINFNCPGLNVQTRLMLPHDIEIKGNINVLNTNGRQLILMSNQGTESQTHWSIDIAGDIIISNNSRVTLSEASPTNNQIFTATVRNISAGGLSFSLQNNNNNGVQPTTLIVKGNIEHSSGTFSANSTAVNESADLFIIEMNGASAQTISSSNGTFDNTDHQVTLKINNTFGVSLLSPLSIGRLNLTAGKLNTTLTNYLTINNTSEESIVLVSSPGSFVDGPVRRVVASTNELVFPTGNGSVKRPISVIPTSNTMTTFQARYINEGSGNNSFASPLDGIEQNYHWEVNRIGAGADAQVRLTLDAAIAGADAADAIVVVKYDGSNWIRARGASASYIPGNQSTGTAVTDPQTSFGLYTFGYGVQAAVLPINLESFNAKKVNSSTQLNWKISENSNPVSFEVTKSADGINFSKIGIVSAFEGKLNYDFTDNSLLAGNNYYRLRMLDKDGKISFSSIVVVMNGTKGVMISSMIPTMVIDRARLNITSSVKGNMQLVVTDISGRIIQNQNVSIDSGNQQVWLNASRLSSGIYQVTGYINGEKTATMRFFKR